jgi:hypothetical protein
MAAFCPSRALYYPHYEFASAAWVKHALLYWEGLLRMAPDHARPADDAEIRQLIDLKLIENVRPEPFFSRTLDRFGERVERVYRASGTLPECIPPLRGIRGFDPKRFEARRAEILRELEARGWKRFAEAAGEGNPRLRAVVYAGHAVVISDQLKVAPVTDDPIFNAVMTFLSEHKVTRDPKQVPPGEGFALAELKVPAPSVDAIADLPVDRLVEVRHKLAEQRRRFRERVQSHASDMAELPNEAAVRAHISAFQAEVKEDMLAAREVLREAKVKDRWSLFSVSAPASLAVGVTLGTAASPLLGPAAAAGTFALSVTNWFVQHRKEKPPGGNYLVSLESAAHEKSSLGDALHKLVA